MNKTIDEIKEKLNEICQPTDDYDEEEIEVGDDLIEDDSENFKDILTDVQIDFTLLNDGDHKKELIIKYNNPYVLLRFLLDYVCYAEKQQTSMAKQNPDIDYIDNYYVYRKNAPVSTWSFEELYSRLDYTNVIKLEKK